MNAGNILVAVLMLGLVVFGALLIGGRDNGSRELRDTREAFREINEMHYYMDDRTGLCFAVINAGYNNAMMANVPCDALNNNYHASHRPASKVWP